MGVFISKQPNGKYCRFSTIIDTITDYNMTEEEYIEMCAERVREEARDVLVNYTRPFEWVINYFYPNNTTREEFVKILKEMGATEEQIAEITHQHEDKGEE